jgi:glutamate racemase
MDDPENPGVNMADTDVQTIMVTDSGLGGLSVFAAIAGGLSAASFSPRVNLVYFNAWPEPDKGYNHYPDMAHKARVFDNALAAMADLQPDILVIACNTLSVIYPYTRFSRTTPVFVQDIIDQGVDMTAAALVNRPDTGVILFGTPTTAASRVHVQKLIRKGIHSDRIINQGCVNLAGKIERNPFDPDLENMIQENVDQAMAKGAFQFPTVAAALCCTHFGYCRALFASAVARHTGTSPLILNPNLGLADQVLSRIGQTMSQAGQAQPGTVLSRSGMDQPQSRLSPALTGETPRITMQVLSRVPWEEQRISAYAKLFTPQAPRVAQALKHYRFTPDLFET